MEHRKRFKAGDWVASITLTVIAVSFVFWWGKKGLGFFDKSFFIDVAYRLLNGQKMYTDFGGLPHGPLTYYLQACFFGLFGLSLTSALLHAAFFNVVAALVIYCYFSRRLKAPWPFFLALLSCVWFYGIISWPWVERISFLGALVSFLIWDNLAVSDEKRSLKVFCIGLLTALPLWDKQNVALVLSLANGLLCLIYVWHFQRWRELAWFFLGYILIGLSLLLYFHFNGFETSYYEYYGRSAAYGRFHALQALPRIFKDWTFLIPMGIMVAAFRIALTGENFPLRWRGMMIVALVWMQFLNTPLNSAPAINNVPLAPLFFGWIILLYAEQTNPLPKADPRGGALLARFSPAKQPLLTAAFIFYLLFGVIVGHERVIWQFAFPAEKRFAPMRHLFFKGFDIQQPQGAEIDAGLAWLEKNLKPDEKFWVFPSLVILYAAMDRLSTAPFVTWEGRNLISHEMRHRDDIRMVEWLKKERPAILALQVTPSHPGDPLHETGFLLQYLPKLKNHIETYYSSAEKQAAFEFFRLKEENSSE